MKPDSVLGYMDYVFNCIISFRDKVVNFFVGIYEFFTSMIVMFNVLYFSIVNSYPILLALYVIFISAFGLSTVTLVLPLVVLTCYYLYDSIDLVFF